jgi:hypothetical protein
MLLLLRSQVRLRPDQASIQKGGMLLAFRPRPSAAPSFYPFVDQPTPLIRTQIVYNQLLNVITYG